MAKYVFWFNKYWDLQRRKGVFSLFRHNSQIGKMTKKNSRDFYQKICPNLLILFLDRSILQITCWPPLDQCALVVLLRAHAVAWCNWFKMYCSTKSSVTYNIFMWDYSSYIFSPIKLIKIGLLAFKDYVYHHLSIYLQI